MKRAKASEIMSSPVIHIRAERPITYAARLMRDRRISGLPVVDADGHLVGVITEGDILAREAVVGGGSALSYTKSGDTPAPRIMATKVGDVMTRNVIVEKPSTPAREIARVMLRHRINRVPIVSDDCVIGIVTRSDIVGLFERPARAVLADVQSLLRDELRINPDSLDIVVRDGVVTILGQTADPGDVSLIEMYVRELDGVTGVDTSGLREPKPEIAPA